MLFKKWLVFVLIGLIVSGGLTAWIYLREDNRKKPAGAMQVLRMKMDGLVIRYA